MNIFFNLHPVGVYIYTNLRGINTILPKPIISLHSGIEEEMIWGRNNQSRYEKHNFLSLNRLYMGIRYFKT